MPDQSNSQLHLLEQYKLFVEMADRVSARRGQMNAFYISLLTALLALLSFIGNKDLGFSFKNDQFQKASVLAIAALGVVSCIIWYFNILSYKQLNASKFVVIHEMEKSLPFPCYEREWEILKKNRSYLQQTNLESYIPFVFMTPYAVLALYILTNLITRIEPR